MTVLKGTIHKNRDGQVFKVVGIKSAEDVKITFPETGYSSRVRPKSILELTARDFTSLEEELESWVPHSEKFTTGRGGEVESLFKKGKWIRVRFLETGYVTVVDAYNARKGTLKDPYAPSFYDVGSVGVSDKSLTYHNQAQQLWRNMVKRCYSEKDDRGYFGRSLVDDRWLCFENFLNDIKHLEGFSDWLKGHTDSYYASNLDKDFYVPGNTLYSRNYCRFLPQAYNKSLGKKNKTEKDWA